MPRRCSRCSTSRKSACKKGLTADVITGDLRKRLSAIEGAFIIVIPPPAVPGIGTGGGFTMRIQDRQGRGPELLAAATDELVAAARKAPGLTQVFSPFTANTPQLFVDIDRVKAQKLGVPIAGVNDTIQTYFGSTYVNDFNLFGRTYHVTAQADLPFRKETADLARLRTRNAAGDMVMLGSVVDFKDVSGPDRVARYNLYPASELAGRYLAGHQFGDRDRHHEASWRRRRCRAASPSSGPICPISRSPAAMPASMYSRSACCSSSSCSRRNMAAGACRSR